MKTSTKILVGAGIAAGLAGGIRANGQESVIAQSRLESVFNKALAIEQGEYKLAGKNVDQRMELDSAVIRQTVNLPQNFKLFGNLEVSVKGYENGMLALQPVSSEYKAIFLAKGQNIGNWTIDIFEISPGKVCLQASHAGKVLLDGDTLKGPFGAINLVNLRSPPYTQMTVVSENGASINTIDGKLEINNPVLHGIRTDDTLAKDNPFLDDNPKKGFHAVDHEGTTRKLDEVIVDSRFMKSNKTMVYHRNGENEPFEHYDSAKVGLTGFHIQGPGLYSSVWRQSTLFFSSTEKTPGGDRQLAQSIYYSSDSSIYLLFDMKMQDGRYVVKNGVFDRIVYDLKNGGKEIAAYRGLYKDTSEYNSFVTEVSPTGDTIRIYSVLYSKDRNAALMRGMMPKDSISTGVGPDPLKLSNGILSVYPNPANGVLNVVVNQERPAKMWINVYDVQGNLVDRVFRGEVLGYETFQYNTEKLAPGMYFVNLGGNAHEAGKGMKFIKE